MGRWTNFVWACRVKSLVNGANVWGIETESGILSKTPRLCLRPLLPHYLGNPVGDRWGLIL